jgi:hypothetical protein
LVIIRQSGGLFAQFVGIVGFAVLIIASRFLEQDFLPVVLQALFVASEAFRDSGSRKGKRSIVVLGPRASIHRLGYRLGTQVLTRSFFGRGECWAGYGW